MVARLKILLVDDNRPDVRLFQESFRALRIPHELQVAYGGEDALNLLSASQSGDLPDIILLDLNMPRIDGFEVLSAIRQNPNLHTIPVIILSSSRDERDVNRAYDLGANCYLNKPMEEFVDLVGDFDRFWLKRARLPVRRKIQSDK